MMHNIKQVNPTLNSLTAEINKNWRLCFTFFATAHSLLFERNSGQTFFLSLTGNRVIAQMVQPEESLSLNGIQDGVYVLRIKGQVFKLVISN
jgi:hypothetical protein